MKEEREQRNEHTGLSTFILNEKLLLNIDIMLFLLKFLKKELIFFVFFVNKKIYFGFVLFKKK